MADITLGQYASRPSAVHSLDPRTKILATLIMMTSLLLTSNLFYLLFMFVVLLGLYRLSQLNPFIALRNVRPFIWLFLITLLLHALFSEGEVLINIPIIHATITGQGLLKGFYYVLRIALLIVAASLLTLTTSPIAITDAVEKFLNPFKRLGLPAHEIAMMMSIALRFIPIFIDEGERIRKAQVSRGADFEGNLMKRLKSIIPLIIPLFISTFRRANDLAVAMDARCYRGGEGRTSYQKLAFRRADAVALMLIIFIGLPVIFLHP